MIGGGSKFYFVAMFSTALTVAILRFGPRMYYLFEEEAHHHSNARDSFDNETHGQVDYILPTVYGAVDPNLKTEGEPIVPHQRNQRRAVRISFHG